MGQKHTKDDILAGALAVAIRDGLSQLSFGRVARQLGISDRTVVYYFPTKDTLVAEVLTAVGLQLLRALAQAVSSAAPGHLGLLRTAWPILAAPGADPVFALFFEASGLAAAGRTPFDTIVPALVDGWVRWAADHIEGTPAQRRTEAEAAIALIDGLLLFRQIAGAERADRAAQRLGIR